MVFQRIADRGRRQDYFVSEAGETIVLKAGRTFEIVSRNKLDGHFVASPADGGGKIFLRADDRVIAVGK